MPEAGQFNGVDPRPLREKLERLAKEIEEGEYSLMEDRILVKASYFDPVKPLDSKLKRKIEKVREAKKGKQRLLADFPDLAALSHRLSDLNNVEFKPRLELLMADIRRELGLEPGDKLKYEDSEEDAFDSKLSKEDTLHLIMCFTDEKGNNGEKAIRGSRTALTNASRTIDKYVSERTTTNYTELIQGTGRKAGFVFLFEDEYRYNQCGLKSYRCFEPEIMEAFVKYLSHRGSLSEIHKMKRVIDRLNHSVDDIADNCVSFMQNRQIERLKAIQKMRLEAQLQVKKNLEEHCVRSIRDILDNHFQTMAVEMGKINGVFDGLEKKLSQFYVEETKTAKNMAKDVVNHHIRGHEQQLKEARRKREELFGEHQLAKLLIIAEDLESNRMYEELTQMVADKATVHLFDKTLTCPLLPPHCIKAILSRIDDTTIQMVFEQARALMTFTNTITEPRDLRLKFEQIWNASSMLQSIEHNPNYVEIQDLMQKAQRDKETKALLQQYGREEISVEDLQLALANKLGKDLVALSKERNIHRDDAGMLDNHISRIIDISGNEGGLRSVYARTMARLPAFHDDPTDISKNLEAMKQLTAVVSIYAASRDEIEQRVRFFGLRIRNCNLYPTRDLLRSRGKMTSFSGRYIEKITEEILQRKEDGYTDQIQPMFVPSYVKVRPLYSTVEQGIIEKEERTTSARDDDDHGRREVDLKKQNTLSRRLPVGFRVLASKPFVYSTVHADMGFGNVRPNRQLNHALGIKKIGYQKQLSSFNKLIPNPRRLGKVKGRWYYEATIENDDDGQGSIMIGYDTSSVDEESDRLALRTGMPNMHFMDRIEPVHSFVQLATTGGLTLSAQRMAEKLHVKGHVMGRQRGSKKKLHMDPSSSSDKKGGGGGGGGGTAAAAAQGSSSISSSSSSGDSSSSRRRSGKDRTRRSRVSLGERGDDKDDGTTTTPMTAMKTRNMSAEDYRVTGCLWENNGILHHNGRRYSTGVTYGKGDTIGCGIDMDNYNFYFTKNGKLLSCSVFDQLREGSLWVGATDEKYDPGTSPTVAEEIEEEIKKTDDDRFDIEMQVRMLAKEKEWPADEWYEYMLKSGRNGDGGLDVIHEMQEEDKKQALDSPMNSFEAEQKVVAQKSKPKDLSYEVFQVAEHLREMFNTFREERLKKMRSRELQPGTTDIVAKSLIKKVGGGVEFVHTTSRLMQPTVVQINGVAAVHRSPILRRYFAIPFVVQAPEIDSIVSFQENSCSGVSTFSHVSSSITQLDIDPIAENKTRKRSNTGSAESEGPPNARKDSNMAGAQFLLRPVVTVFSGHVKPRMSVGLRFEEPLLHRLTGFHPVAQSYD